ncbi:MAG: hypothetical protein HY015_00210 [Bacteroidetes bacterium]|nr:hypothetical protein [Bacteroidota bacterium]MBI3481403.1 hypothetical protein [Bacteroidota bacterium]
MKPFKNLTLIVTSLLVVALSLSFTNSFDPSTSIQNKSIEYHIAALAADDIEDDFPEPEFQVVCTISLPSFAWQERSLAETIPQNSVVSKSSTPFYLQIRSLRI